MRGESRARGGEERRECSSLPLMSELSRGGRVMLSLGSRGDWSYGERLDFVHMRYVGSSNEFFRLLVTSFLPV